MEDTRPQSDSAAESHTGEWTRVVVLAPAGAGTSAIDTGPSSPVPPQLAEEFRKRDWFAVMQYDPYLAFLDLALRERAQAARAAWGLQRMERLALVVLNPGQWEASLIDSLAAAIGQWLPPSVSVWLAENDELHPATEPMIDRIVLSATDGTSSVAPAAAEPQREPNSVVRPSADQHRLSREEIDMLLQEHQTAEQPDRADASEDGNA